VSRLLRASCSGNPLAKKAIMGGDAHETFMGLLDDELAAIVHDRHSF